MWMGWIALASAVAACDTTTDRAAFRRGVDAAWAAVEAEDYVAVVERRLAVERSLPCVAEPLDRTDAAAFHRVRAVEALYAGDDRGAQVSAWAAQRLDPDGTLAAAEQAPPFADLIETPSPATVTDAFGTSLAATVIVDGAERPVRVVGQPMLVQVFDRAGAPIDAAWVDGRDLLPDWVAFPRVRCPAPVPVTTLLAASAAAERAYAELDVPGFTRALRDVAAGLPCVTGPVATPQAAAIHRLEGLRLYTVGAELSALRALQQALTLDPLFEPPETVVRPGSRLARLWDRAAAAPPSPWIDAPVLEGVELSVDGLAARVRPAALPSIVQVGSPTGEVLWTRYVPAGAPLPDLTEVSREAAVRAREAIPPAERLYLDAASRRRQRLRRAGLTVGGALAYTLSAAFFLSNDALVDEFQAPTTRPDRRNQLRNQANASAFLSATFFVGGTGFIGAAILVP